MTMNSRFPAEVMVNILSHLPIKALVRFRSVCKPWFRLLTGDPYFTQIYARQTSIENPNFLLMQFQHPFDCANRFYVTPDYTQFDKLIQIEAPTYWARVYGICNGLVLYGENDDLFIWNPITDSIKLPDLPDLSHFYRNKRKVYGFGFIESTNEYKVVGVVITSLGSCLEKYGHQCHVNVHTLGTNTWRTLQDVPFNVHPGRISKCGALVHGALHWIACEAKYKDNERLVSFNLNHEIFQEIGTPEGVITGNYHLTVQVGELSGMLALFRKAPKKKFEIWVMTEYGVEDSWTKQYTIRSSEIPNFSRPLGVATDGDIMMMNSKVLVLFNPKTNSISTTDIIGPPVLGHTIGACTDLSKWYCSEAYLYKWSLVSPRRIHPANITEGDQQRGRERKAGI